MRPSMASRKDSMRPLQRNSAPRPPASNPALLDKAAAVDALLASTRSPARASVAAGTKRKEREPDDDRETNINVVVRCRGRNDREVRENSGVVVSTQGPLGNTVELSIGPNPLNNKTYHFDRVLSAAADQDTTFKEVVQPLLDEVHKGFNCTVFAYGQTGTGKTYTMSGDIKDSQPLPEAAGIIPRVLYHLFDRLNSDDTEPEWSVKCSFIELYNEELRDLLSPDDSIKLRIYDDNKKTTYTTTQVQGMQELYIRSATKGLELLKNGSHKRQVAATKCNDLSSRSHTIFTLTVHKKSLDGSDDYVTAGKLNLVDLAGSENIQRSGADNKRAVEAGVINKSLLTLGRVINALVEKSTHIPYRESKLTRLLQDSLGGRTKTLIIATLSPAKSNLEETMSTLDYAFRAKNIRNKPQEAPLLPKRTLLKDMTDELAKLRTELVAARQKEGVWMSQDTYDDARIESESQRILTKEQKDRIETMEISLRNKVQELFAMTNKFNKLKKDDDMVRMSLTTKTEVLDQVEIVLQHTQKTLAEEAYLRRAYESSEKQLTQVGHDLMSVLETTKGDVDGLHSGLRRRSGLHATNRQQWSTHALKVSETTSLVERKLEDARMNQDDLINSLNVRMQTHVADEMHSVNEMAETLRERAQNLHAANAAVSSRDTASRRDIDAALDLIDNLRHETHEDVGRGLEQLANAANATTTETAAHLEDYHSQLHKAFPEIATTLRGILIKNINHLTSQSTNIRNMYVKLFAANTAMRESHQLYRSAIEQAVQHERDVASEERRKLLSGIEGLITSSAERQDTRLRNVIEHAAKRQKTSTDEHVKIEKEYSELTNEWLYRDDDHYKQCHKDRDHVKNLMTTEWAEIEKASKQGMQLNSNAGQRLAELIAAQSALKQGHATTLDDIYDKVRDHSGLNDSVAAEEHSKMMESVQETYADVNTHLNAAFARTQDVEKSMRRHVKNMSATTHALSHEAPARQALVDLREQTLSSNLLEYVPTGQTPAKTLYKHPSILPHTVSQAQILEQMRANSTPSAAVVSSGKDSVSRTANASPSKALVYHDAQGQDTPTRSEKGGISSQTLNGLRTVDVNVPPSVSTARSANGTTPIEKVTTNGVNGDTHGKRAHTMQPAEIQKVDQGPAARRITDGLAVGSDGIARTTGSGQVISPADPRRRPKARSGR